MLKGCWSLHSQVCAVGTVCPMHRCGINTEMKGDRGVRPSRRLVDAYCVLAWGLRVAGRLHHQAGPGTGISHLGFGDPMEQVVVEGNCLWKRWVVGLWECSGAGGNLTTGVEAAGWGDRDEWEPGNWG